MTTGSRPAVCPAINEGDGPVFSDMEKNTSKLLDSCEGFVKSSLKATLSCAKGEQGELNSFLHQSINGKGFILPPANSSLEEVHDAKGRQDRDRPGRG